MAGRWKSDLLAIMLGGRAAEELGTGDIRTGAADDLKKTTRLGHENGLFLGDERADRVGGFSP